jgi:drug/metabolite transporter (DMT)-like permease
MSPITTTFFYYLFSLVIAGVVWILFRERAPIPRGALVWPALIAVFLFVSVLSFNIAVQTMSVSAGATIRSLSFIITILLGVVVSQEKLSAKDYVAVGLAVSAVVLFGYSGTASSEAERASQGVVESDPR